MPEAAGNTSEKGKAAPGFSTEQASEGSAATATELPRARRKSLRGRTPVSSDANAPIIPGVWTVLISVQGGKSRRDLGEKTSGDPTGPDLLQSDRTCRLQRYERLAFGHWAT